MKKIILYLLLCASGNLVAQEAISRLSAGDWAQPRNGLSLARQPAIASAVAQLLKHPEGRLLIRYPGGDEGSQWGGEVRAWLVALGISSARIELVPGSRDPEYIDLELVLQRTAKPVSLLTASDSGIAGEARP